jgi:O-antigen/teichoic acid export membrane protein
VNIGFIMGSNLLGRVLNLVLQAALARAFGPLGLGGYATAVAIAGYFVFAVDFGLSPRFAREGAVAPDRQADEYARALGLKCVTGVCALAALALICHVLPYEDDIRQLCFLLGCSSIIRSFCYLNDAVCRANERLDLEGAANLLGTGAFVGISLVLLALGHPVLSVGYASIAAIVVQLALSTLFASRFIRLRVDLGIHRETARAALPYAMTSLTVLAFAQIDILLISFVESQEFVGQYASVSRVLLIVGTVGALASAAILPTLARLFVNLDPEGFRELVDELVRGMLLVSGLVTLGTFVLAQPLIIGIYGDAFAAFSFLLQGGSVYLLFKLTVSALGAVLTAIGRQGDRARGMLIGVGATVVLVLTLVPVFGIGGAVGAMVGSELVLMSVLALYLQGVLTWTRHLQTAVVTGIACGLGATLYLWMGEQTDLVWRAAAVVLPVLVYVAVGLVSGEAIRAIRFLRKLRSANWQAERSLQ